MKLKRLDMMKIFALVITLIALVQPSIAQNKNIELLIDQFADENSFNGTVLIKQNNHLLYHKSFGLANRELNIPNTNKTQYAIASITKLFTSVIILQLVEEGKIDLRKTIPHYLPDYKKDIGNKITIHNLLTHTSGLQNCEEKQSDQNHLPDIYLEDVTVDILIQKYCSGPLVHSAGTTFEYNNADYIILGKIIEKVSQDSFGGVLKSRILTPLKMDRTGLITRSEDIEKLAQGYKWNNDNNFFEIDPERLFQNYYASGAMYSTTEDLMKFTEALFGGYLLDETSVELLLRTYPETNSYGYGLWVRYPNYNKTVPKVAQRFGRIWGINTLLSHFIDHDISVIVLANTDNVYVSDFQNIVGEELLD